MENGVEGSIPKKLHNVTSSGFRRKIAHFYDKVLLAKEDFWGTNLFQKADHESEHCLRFFYANVKSALIAHFYKGWNPNFEINVARFARNIAK